MFALINDGNSFNQLFKNLLNKCDKVAFAVAWASADTEIMENLSRMRNKITKAVIGTHFYQTHPDVLDLFVGFDSLKFILQPQGVFHPKVYLFWSAEKWDLLIGSANLTKGAISNNKEVMLHVSSDCANPEMKEQAENIISGFWENGYVVTSEKAFTYRELWKVQQPSLNRISGLYGSSKETRPPLETPQFSDMSFEVRKTIAGLPNNWDYRWGWFGSMRGAGYYHQAVNENNQHLSAALDYIPLTGAVTYEDYKNYINEFLWAFPNGRDGIAVASRLITLKRPDYFVCLNSRNLKKLCSDFGLKSASVSYDQYWSDIICRIMDSVWWNEPKPVEKIAAMAWNGRSAMLDALFYEP